MDIEHVYRALARGEADPTDLAWSRRALQLLALERATQGDPEQRLEALQVAAQLGLKYGLPVTHELVLDPDPRVRTMAFNQAVAARDEGLPAIRRAATGADTDLAVAAFDLLVGWCDAHGVAAAKRALASPDARLRRRATVLLGLSGGRGVLAELERMRADADEEVRALAAIAVAQVTGEKPKPAPKAWWDDATAEPVPEPVRVPDPEPPTEPTAEPQLPAPPPTPAAEPEMPATGFAALPATMPTETRALTRLLGMIAPGDRSPVVGELKARGSELQALWFAWRPGGDRALGRGLALSAAALGTGGASAKVAAMLTDPDPPVRAAAAESLGALGTPGQIPALAQRIGDPDPDVAASAVRGLAALAIRLGRPELARDQLARVGAGRPDPVVAALAEARALLGG